MEINGILIVDKPDGMLSLDVVREIKRRFQIRKAGHIGTLDPFATGVLPIALNEGTKLVPFIKEEPKEYEGVIKLGEETTTGDLTGKITYKKQCDGISKELIFQSFYSFLGKSLQIPPMFSAVKIEGKPLYKLARKGIEIERKPREIEIFSIKVIEVEIPLIRFYVSCSKGTYIRALAIDIGRKLGCGAHLVKLRRNKSGFFNLKQAIPWDILIHLNNPEEFFDHVISLNESLPHFIEIIGDEDLIRRVRQGQWLEKDELTQQYINQIKNESFIKLSSPQGELVAILKMESMRMNCEIGKEKIILRPVRIFKSISHSAPQFKYEKKYWSSRVSIN